MNPAAKPAAQEIASNPDMNEKEAQPSHVTPSGAAGVPVLDETIYRKLTGSMPAPQLKEMYSMCVNDARARIVSMRQTLATARDSAQFIREAHAIKGSCGMLGATELHRIAAGLETSGLAPGVCLLR